MHITYQLEAIEKNISLYTYLLNLKKRGEEMNDKYLYVCVLKSFLGLIEPYVLKIV